MKHTLLIPMAALWLCSYVPAQVIPMPQRMSQSPWPASAGTILRGVQGITCLEPSFTPQIEVLRGSLQKLGANPLPLVKKGGTLIFMKGELKEGHSYHIESLAGTLVVRASQPEGVAHAVSTLLQLVVIEEGRALWQALDVVDGPDHTYRSFMVDMGRNPHSPETLRRVIDMMGFYKLNYLHLHLGDDQLFSWPSRAFPKLLSQRAGWSWQEFEALESYSQARGVTLLPELDVPGHSTLLRRHYPEVFGKTPTELASLPQAQEGVEKLLGEMLSVFQATPYVHIGGDEAYGVPEEIQRDFINRLNGYLKRKGKRTVVWEGPRLGEGKNKVSTDVLHINWRTINFPAQSMLDAGYQVVNAAWDPFYVVDHYPQTMFTAVSLEGLYRWDWRRFAHVNHGIPTFKNPHRTKTLDGIVGFCLPWWEGREENLMPLCLPRLAAAACPAWNSAGEVDFQGFLKRQQDALQRLQAISEIRLPALPMAEAETQSTNLAFRAKVTPTRGASQPHFGPQRLTNGLTDRFDHFLGFPTQPEPLEIVIELLRPAHVGRIVIYETAVGESHEIYQLLVSASGESYEAVGVAQKGSRGEKNHVTHEFPRRHVQFIKIRTEGCHGLTFPSFSHLTEVQAFAQ